MTLCIAPRLQLRSNWTAGLLTSSIELLKYGASDNSGADTLSSYLSARIRSGSPRLELELDIRCW